MPGLSTAHARLKVHRRSMALAGRRATVLSLRPGMPHRFATNRFHDTWHVLSSSWGGHLLGRVCWSMAYQRRPHTVFVIDQRHLVPNPFDADPSWPIAVVNADLGGLGRDAARALAARLPLRTPSDGTVTLQSHGLDAAIADEHFFTGRPWWWWDGRRHEYRHWVEQTDGLLVLAGAPEMLRAWAVDLAGLRLDDDAFLDGPGNGEVQVFRDFHRRIGRARVARERLFPDRHQLAQPERELLWSVDVTTRGWPARAALAAAHAEDAFATAEANRSPP